MKSVLISSLLILTCSCFGQSKLIDMKITLDVRDAPFEAIIEKLRKEYQINIVYSSDRLLFLDQTITVKAIDMPLAELMKIIGNRYNLSVEFLNNYVILRMGERKQIVNSPKPLNTPKPQEEKRVIADTTEVPSAKIAITSVTNDAKTDSVVSIVVVQNKSQDTAQIEEPNISQQKSKVSHFIAAFMSVDNHQYHFRALADPNQEFTSSLTVALNAYSFTLTIKNSSNSTVFSNSGTVTSGHIGYVGGDINWNAHLNGTGSIVPTGTYTYSLTLINCSQNTVYNGSLYVIY